MFPQVPEPEKRVYSSFAEIDQDPLFRGGSEENAVANAQLFADDPILANNVTNSLKQILTSSQENEQAAKGIKSSGQYVPVTPQVPQRSEPQPEALLLASLGLPEGHYTENDQIATAIRRQRVRTEHAAKRYEAALAPLVQTYGAEKLLKLDPNALADQIDAAGGFEDESGKVDFVRNATDFHDGIGVSPFHALRARAVKGLPDYQLGQGVYLQVKSSTSEKPFRFTLDEPGRKQFQAYQRYYDGQVAEALGGNTTDIFYTIGDMIGNSVAGVAQSADPDSIISDEWRSDPEKLKRARLAIAKIKDFDKNFRNNTVVKGKERERVARIAREAGKFENIPSGDFIISDPSASAGQEFANNSDVFRELIDLEKEGAFSKRSRLSPVIGLLDAFLYGTGALAGVGLYSTDPNSVVNNVQSLSDLTSRDKEIASMQRINEAITWQELQSDWRDGRGPVFDSGESPWSSNPQMIRGPGEIIDPMMAVGGIKWLRHLKRAGMTGKAVTAEVLKNTELLRRLGNKAIQLPPEIRQQVNLVRSTITAEGMEFAGKELTDWDVLDIIGRGKGKVPKLNQDGTLAGIAEISPSELRRLGDGIDSFTQSVRSSQARRASTAAALARSTPSKPFSQFGAFVANHIPAELRGIADLPVYKSVVGFFSKLRKTAQDAKPIGEAVIGETPNRAIAFGAKKIAGGLALAAGTNWVISGGQNANPFATNLPGMYIGGVYALNDVLVAMEYTGDKGKFIGEFIQATSSGRQINGSVAAYKVQEKAAEIRKLTLELGQELTESERALKVSQIENLKSEVSTWHSFRANGMERALLFTGNQVKNGLQGGAILDIMMSANDRQSSGAYALAGTMGLINAGFGSFYRNVNSGRVRRDQQRSVFAYNLMNMEPVQAARAMEAYNTWKEKGFGDEWIAIVNQAQQSASATQTFRLVTPAEMHVNSLLLSASDIMPNPDQSSFVLRQNMIDEFSRRNPDATPAEAEAYVENEINLMLTRKAANQAAIVAEKEKISLENRVNTLATRLDQNTIELTAANQVVAEDLAAMRIPGLGDTSIATSFKAEDLTSLGAFEAALARAGVNWRSTSLFQDPDVLKKFSAARASISEYIKLKNAYDSDALKFGEAQVLLERARAESARAGDEALLAGEHQWRPGQTFTHTDYTTGLSSVGTVVANGVYIVDHTKVHNPDYDAADPASDPMVHSSVVMIDYTKVDPKTVYEEWGHKLFVSETFRDARVLLYRDAIGEWGYNDNGEYVLKNKGWAWETSVDENGKEVHSFPLLRAFAQSYADRLPPELGKAYMAEFDVSTERFNENPTANQAMFTNVFNELYANAYAQRMLMIDTSSGKISSDSTTARAGLEGSPMLPYSEQGLNPTTAFKVVFGKLMNGELTSSEFYSVVKAIRSGNTADLTPEARNFISGRASEFARAAKAANSNAGGFVPTVVGPDANLSEFLKYLSAGNNPFQDMSLDMVAMIADDFGKGGRLDSLIIRGAHERLLAQGLSPEIFGNGGWQTGAIFDDEGNAATMPGNISRLVDMVRYNTRTRVGNPDPALMGSINFWNEDGSFNPEKAKGSDIVLWAAVNGKPHWIDPKNKSRLKDMSVIIRENNQAYDSFKNLVIGLQSSKKSTGISVRDTEDGFTVSGRFTKDDIDSFNKALEGSNFHPTEVRYIRDIIDSLSEVHNQNVPVFVAQYKSMQSASVGSPKLATRPGGYNSQRALVPISVEVRQTTIDYNGNKLPNNQKMSMLYTRAVGIDEFRRRSLLAWNGALLDEKNVPVVSRDKIRALFQGDGKVFNQALFDYLALLSSGGEITLNKNTTKYPIMNTVDMFAEQINLDPARYGMEGQSPAAIKAVASEMARIVHGTVGAPNVKQIREREAKLTEAAEESGLDPDEMGPVLNDNERGRLRIFDNERSIGKPTWGMRDKNFLITDFRADRIIHLRRTDSSIPWGPYSYHWNQVAYGAKSPNSWISVRDGKKPITGVGLHIANIVQANAEEGKKLIDLGVSDVFDHGSGYKIVLTGAGTFKVYDTSGKYVGDTTQFPAAQRMAVANGFNKPISTRHLFDRDMVKFGFTPQGIEYVNPKGGFIRRTRYISKDGLIQVSFTNSGTAIISDVGSRSTNITGPRTIAKDIRVEADGKGGFDMSELAEAIEFSRDELTSTGPVTHEIFGQEVTLTETRQREVFGNVDPDMLEFMPLTIGRAVEGKRVFAKNNPAYYAFKRKLVDYVGSYKESNRLLNQMKKDLGVEVVETDAVAVGAWVEKYIKENQARLDAEAKAIRDAVDAKREAKITKNFLDPIAEVFANADAQRASEGLPPIVISVNDAREALLASVGKFSQLAMVQKQAGVPNPSTDIGFQTLDAEARGRYLKSLNEASRAVSESKGQIGNVINQMWINASGYILSQELLPSPPLIGGISGSVDLTRFARNMIGREAPAFGVGSGRDSFGFGKGKERNAIRYKFVIYSPGGAIVGQAQTREEAFKLLLAVENTNIRVRLRQSEAEGRRRK